MPRIGQLLSALLIVLLGVLVVQMFLLAALHQERAEDLVTPPGASGSRAAPAPQGNVLLATALDPGSDQLAPAAPEPRLVVIIVAQQDQPATRADGGQALIERFIALTDARLHPSHSGKED